MEAIISAFEAGHYQAVITAFGEYQPRSAAEYRYLGMALLRSGRFVDAEVPLLKGSMLGDQEAQVELGNLMRVLGRYQDAISHFREITGSLGGELLLRAQRWWGTAEFQVGDVEAGIRRCERAWYGYMALGDDELTARVTQNLAWMHYRVGDYQRAKQMYMEALRVLPNEPLPHPRLTALTNLINIQLETGDFNSAYETLAEAKISLQYTESIRERLLVLSSEADLLRLTGQYARYVHLLEEILPLSEELQDHTARTWAISRLADHYSSVRLHGKALQVLFSFGKSVSNLPAELVATAGILARRRGEYQEALTELARACQLFREAGRVPELLRVLLHHADAALKANDPPLAAQSLREALTIMMRLRHLARFGPDLEELAELLHYAQLEPDLEPYMEPLLESLALLAGQPAGGAREQVRQQLQIGTLGRLTVHRNGEEVNFSLADAPLVLLYVALHPGRARSVIQADLFPEKDAAAGAAYFRSAVKDLRDRLGKDVVVGSGPHNAPTYSLNSQVQVEIDLVALDEAVARSELARALALYRGEFVPGETDSEWVLQQRDRARLGLTLELQALIARYESEGDLKRVVLLTNQYLRVDPYDIEMLERRVAAARRVSSPQDIARYLSELRRMRD